MISTSSAMNYFAAAVDMASPSKVIENNTNLEHNGNIPTCNIIACHDAWITLQHPASGRFLGYHNGHIRFLENSSGDHFPIVSIFKVVTEHEGKRKHNLHKPKLAGIDMTNLTFQAVCLRHLSTSKYLAHGWTNTIQLEDEPQWFYLVKGSNDAKTIRLFCFSGKFKQCSWVSYEGGNLVLGKPYGILQALQSPSAIFQKGISNAVLFVLHNVEKRSVSLQNLNIPAKTIDGEVHQIHVDMDSAHSGESSTDSPNSDCIALSPCARRQYNEGIVVAPDGTRRVVVYENQRWSKKRHAYVPMTREKDGVFPFTSDSEGQVFYDSEESPPGSSTALIPSSDIAYAEMNGWRWVESSSWTCSYESTVDAEGWWYGNKLKKLYPSTARRGMRHMKIRQRQWFRHIVPPSSYEWECDAAKKDMEAIEKHWSKLQVGKIYMHKVAHLILLVHGVGRHDDEKMRKKQEELRSTIEYLYHKLGGNPQFRAHNGYTEIEYVQWHDELHDDEGLDQKMSSLSLESVPGLRKMFRETVLDAASYMGTYDIAIQDVVVTSLNAKVSAFRAAHPNFSGKVSILGHSLGSIISFDILTKFPERLKFHPEALFALGSPIGLFLAIRRHSTKEILAMFNGLRSHGIRFYNIFHPVDPVAHKVEPLIYGSVSVPCTIQSYNSGQYMESRHIYREYDEESEYRQRIDYQLHQPFSLGDATNYFAVMNAHRAYWGNKHVMKFILEHALAWSEIRTSNVAAAVEKFLPEVDCHCISCDEIIRPTAKFCCCCGAKQPV